MQILDDTFASHMQQLLGNALHEKDLEPPRSIMEVRSMLCKDAPNHYQFTINYYIVPKAKLSILNLIVISKLVVVE